MISIRLLFFYEITMIKLIMIKIVIVEIFQKECAFLSSMNWNATNKNLTENSVRIKHFFMKESKGKLTIRKVANVNNSNNPNV